MQRYIKSEQLDHEYPAAFKNYPRTDNGRFDICRSCPLKMAILALKEKQKSKM